MNSTTTTVDVVDVETCDACGYVAAILAAILLGTSGVPIKTEIIQTLDVDHLVLQTYKTGVAFVACWVVTMASGGQRPYRLTAWGIASGLFSVPGGLASVYGVRSAGLAVAFGIYASVTVLTSFIWGVFIFREHVASKFGACCAAGLLIAGLCGMAAHSQGQQTKPTRGKTCDEDATIATAATTTTTTTVDVVGVVDEEELDGVRKRKHQNDEVVSSTFSSSPKLPLEMESLLSEEDEKEVMNVDDKKSSKVLFLGSRVSLTKPQSGILASIFGGTWGGMNLVPMHYAAIDGYGGPTYVLSFFSGCMFVIIMIWLVRLLFELYRHDGNVGKAYHALPSFHYRQIWLYGSMAGLCLSGGKFMTIIAVTHLGQGVGNSFAQTSMLVGGLWGIFVFKEIEGRDRILKWLFSACIALTGVLGLSYEHSS